MSHLRLLRLTAGLRQRDVAARAGVTRETVALLELGGRRPSLRTAQAIAAALDVPIEAAFPHAHNDRGGPTKAPAGKPSITSARSPV